MKNPTFRRLLGSLTLRMVIPVVLVTSLVGLGLYYFVLKAVSSFADRQINKELAGISRDFYDICDRGFTELMQSGQMDDDKSVRIKKALTLGAIEEYASRNHLGCRVYDEGGNDVLHMNIFQAVQDHIKENHPEGKSSFAVYFAEKAYYVTHLEFRPWYWHLDLIKDTEVYAPLVRQVKMAYIVTGGLLLLSVFILVLLMERLLSKPINSMIKAIRAGEPPNFRGINELEFLSASITEMMRSLDDRSRWIERLYRIAVTNRGESFISGIAEAISEAMSLHTLITRVKRDGEEFVVASSSQNSGAAISTFKTDGLPIQRIFRERQPVIIPSGAYRTLFEASFISKAGAESYVGLPIFDHEGEIIGIIHAFGGERTLSEWDLNLIKTAGQMVGAEFELMEKEKEKEHFRDQVFKAQKLESLGMLAGGIAHNFNNLLMVILGRANLMMMEMDHRDPNYNNLKAIEDCVRSAAELTRQLLGFARGGKYEVKTTDLNEIVSRTTDLFGKTKKEIRIHKILQQDLWIVEVDRSQIEQVLLNLLVNAWQAMGEGGDLYIETKNTALENGYVKTHGVEAGDYVKLSVTDTGSGMDEETKQRLFLPFFTTKDVGKGTGLGLASAYGIIKNHKGIITAYSEKGHGSTFNIYLPASGGKVSEEKGSHGNILTGEGTLLLVDDEEMILEVCKSMLESLGYEVLTARSGQEAIHVYEKHRTRIRLVILDMIMPGIGGGQAFDELKKINPDIRILLASGYSINGQAQAILNRGCAGFIQKPFHYNELSKRVREILHDASEVKMSPAH